MGLFASRAPHRPNPIALSALKISHIDCAAGTITVLGLDLLNGTPILDIKPYIPAFDAFPDARAGWMDLIDGGDYETSRRTGYQTIVSPRGMRASRSKQRKALEEKRRGEGSNGIEIVQSEEEQKIEVEEVVASTEDKAAEI